MIEIVQSAAFVKWLSGLRDGHAKARINDRLLRFYAGNFGDVTPVGGGVSEARIHYGPGYRLYFIQRGKMLVVMLGGGDKASQQKDISKAQKLAKEWSGL